MRIAVIPGRRNWKRRDGGSRQSARRRAPKSGRRSGSRASAVERRSLSGDRRDAARATAIGCCATSSRRSSSARWAIRACPTTATRATSCSARASSSICMSTTVRCGCIDDRLSPLKDRDAQGHQLRRLSREHRRRLRQRRRALQGRDRRRGRDSGGDQHLQGREPDRPPRVRVRRDARPDKGLHGGQEQRHAAGTRVVAARLQAGGVASIRESPRRTCTSMRWRCSWSRIRASSR